MSDLIVEYKPEIVFCGATSLGRSLIPRVAAQIGADNYLQRRQVTSTIGADTTETESTIEGSPGAVRRDSTTIETREGLYIEFEGSKYIRTQLTIIYILILTIGILIVYNGSSWSREDNYKSSIRT